jgi:DNA topoisomerase-3
MKVILTEKPSVARDIARVLGVNNKRNGYIEGRGCAVTWAYGHLVTLQEPGDYNPELKRWSLETLPIIPDEFKLNPISSSHSKDQLKVIRKLFQEADEIICATDAGREGELIFRYILSLCNCSDKPFRRLWLSSLTEEAIQEGFKTLRDGLEMKPLYEAARCRSESDWVVGLNATRCYTVRYGRIGGKDRVLWSIGRVQTPVLAMIVERDDQIIQFRSQPFWELKTSYRDIVFKYTGDRFDQPASAQVLLDRIKGRPFQITSVSGKKKTEQPPQLFDLTTLQRELNKREGLSAADTLATMQKLYESKLVTYPRTDSRYLSEDMKSRIPGIFSQLKGLKDEDISRLQINNLPFTKRIIDDQKVTDHHAIIPTGVLPRNLSTREQQVYDAVLTQFIAAFYPPCVKRVTTANGQVEDVEFIAKGVQVIEPGWSLLFPSSRKKAKEDQILPAFEKNETGPHTPSLREGKTKPPKAFTENSLLGAMESAGKAVEDEALREALKDRGIGTPATRAAIIETLLRRNYIRREKKVLKCTDMGRCLIALIRDADLRSPEMTGAWEEKLKRIERDELTPSSFSKEICHYTHALISESKGVLDTSRLGACPYCGRDVIRGKKALGCSGWKEGCLFILDPEYKGLSLSLGQVRVLLQLHILPYSVQIDGEPRLLILSTQGQLMDLSLPTAGSQQKGSR